MDLNKLFALLCKKKLGYIACDNHIQDRIRFFASIGYNGRGKAIELTIYEGVISIMLMTKESEPTEEKNITEERVFELIENFETKSN